MKKRLKYLTIIFIAAQTILCAGCINVQTPKTPYLKLKKYLLSVKMPVQSTKKENNKNVLAVNNTIIVDSFSGSNFIYRTNKMNYLEDYYNIFLIPPARQIDGVLIQYLTQSGLFNYVEQNNNVLKPTYLLRSKVLALYADYRNREHPKAMIAINFSFFKKKGKSTNMIFSKTFHSAIPIKQKNSESLVSSWNIALEKILQNLSEELRGTL